jgi:hypothetical protein
VWDVENNNLHSKNSLVDLLEAGKKFDFAAIILARADISAIAVDEHLLNCPGIVVCSS